MSNSVCQPQMLDPLTVVNSYLANPSPLRLTCRFMVGSYAHSVYLETEQHVPYVASRTDSGDSRNFFPIKWKNFVRVAPGSLPSGSQLCLVDLHHKEEVTSDLLPSMDSAVSDAWFNSRQFQERPKLEVHVVRMKRLRILGEKHGQILWCRPDVTEVLLRDLPRLERIADAWSCNIGAKTLSVNRLPELKDIGDTFGHGCRALETVEFGPDLPKLEKIGGHFFSYCSSLKSFSLVGLQSLQTIGTCVLIRCKALHSVTFENLPELLDVGDMCLLDSDALQHLKLVNLPKLKWIGPDFANKCPELRTALFKDLPRLKVNRIMSHSSHVVATFENVPLVELSGRTEPWAPHHIEQ